MPELYVEGTWRTAGDGGRRDVICPADGIVVTKVDEATPADADAAATAARRAFDEGPWPRTPARERGDLLLRVASLLERDKTEIARAESLDTGKRLVESEYDVDDVIAVFRYYGGIAGTEAGRVVDTGRDDAIARIVYEPVGVCVLITPWNYPLLQTSWKVAAALAAGNTFVLKPSELTPLDRDPASQDSGGGGPAPRRRQSHPRREGSRSIPRPTSSRSPEGSRPGARS